MSMGLNTYSTSTKSFFITSFNSVKGLKSRLQKEILSIWDIKSDKKP